jgi:hypothetical protein
LRDFLFRGGNAERLIGVIDGDATKNQSRFELLPLKQLELAFTGAV